MPPPLWQLRVAENRHSQAKNFPNRENCEIGEISLSRTLIQLIAYQSIWKEGQKLFIKALFSQFSLLSRLN